MTYCESEKFEGWDPYDGLNSKLINNSILFKSDIFRLIWIQSFKRSPINFRKITCVPKEFNSKGIALLLSGYCNLYNYLKNENSKVFDSKQVYNKIFYLAELLLKLKVDGYSGDCWGYNFPWQARRLFFFSKKYTNYCCNILLFGGLISGI